MLTLSMMQTMWPQNTSQPPRPAEQLLKCIAQDSARVFAKYGLNNDLLVAHAMSQFGHECGNGRAMTESISYTPQRAAEVWPSRFSSAADCLAKVGCQAGDPNFPVKLINQVYGGRNGNRAGTDDGSRFIGRGLAQVTGRANYEQLGKLTGLPLADQPDLVNQPEHALECGVGMFILRGCLEPAKANDVARVTLKLNGGNVGLQDRIVKLDQWKSALLQHALNRLKVADPALVTDGQFGKKSIEALMNFQRRHQIEPNGNRDDARTLDAIESALAAL